MASKFPIAYIQDFQPEARARIRKRFSKEIDYLKANGFQELCFYSEQTPPLSLRRIGYMIILVLMFFSQEVLRVQGQRQVTASILLLVHPERATLALPMGMGIKLYTAQAFGGCAR